MLIQMGTWNRIRDQFSQEEKDLLNLAVTGETICPRGLIVDEQSLPADLARKLCASKVRAKHA